MTAQWLVSIILMYDQVNTHLMYEEHLATLSLLT